MLVEYSFMNINIMNTMNEISREKRNHKDPFLMIEIANKSII